MNSAAKITPDSLTDDQILDADLRGLVTQAVARIAARPMRGIACITARQMVCDAINARAKDGAK